MVSAAVFETVLVEAHRVRLLDQHLARLGRSGVAAARIAAARRLLDQYLACDQTMVVRVDSGRSGLVVTTRPPPAAQSAALVTVNGFDPADQRRSLKRSDRRWAEAATRQAGGADALLTSRQGVVGETPIANVFCYRGGRVLTPPARGILPGVTRGWLIAAADAEEQHLTAADLAAADAVFTTNAVRGVVEVDTLDQHRLSRHPLVAELQAAWRAL